MVKSIMYKISITGKANTGKNTLSKMLAKQIRLLKSDKYLSVGYIAFADPIKKMALQMFPRLPKKYLFGSSKYRNEIIAGAYKNGEALTVRQLLLDLGTEVGRGYKNDMWLDNFDYYFNKMIEKKIIVVTDVRFRNEFNHLKEKGFYQIRLYRNVESSNINHISETDQNNIQDDEFDYVIHNNKSLHDLKLEVANNIVPNLIG
jgi:hypothetical protein